MHANKSDKAISRVSHSMGPVNNIVKNFDSKHHLYQSDFCCSKNDRDVIGSPCRTPVEARICHWPKHNSAG